MYSILSAKIKKNFGMSKRKTCFLLSKLLPGHPALVLYFEPIFPFGSVRRHIITVEKRYMMNTASSQTAWSGGASVLRPALADAFHIVCRLVTSHISVFHDRIVVETGIAQVEYII
jgi:hypothetical protein